MELIGNCLRSKSYGSNWGMAIVLEAETKKSWRVTGQLVNHLNLVESQKYRIHGDVKKHPKHGEHLEASHIEPVIEDTQDALIRYMQRIYAGCGKANAKRVLDWFHSDSTQSELLDILRYRPWDLLICPIVKGKFRSSVAKTREQGLRITILREMTDYLQGLPISDGLLDRMTNWAARRAGIQINETGENAFQSIDEIAASIIKKLKDNPYAAFGDVSGYDFQLAEKIGHLHAIQNDDPRRIAALSLHALNTGCLRWGHTHLNADEFRQQYDALEQDRQYPFTKIKEALPFIMSHIVVQDGVIYPRILFDAEKSLALEFNKRLIKTITPIIASTQKADDMIRTASASLGLKLDTEQHSAILKIMTSPCAVHTITAGPGCGKTAIMEVMAFALNGKDILCCAPTGKAARVLSDRISKYDLTAVTVHRLLEPSSMSDNGFLFEKNQTNPLEGRILIVDETGMLDLLIGSALFEAIPPNMHVIFLGDPNQLPSVSPGNFLSDILKLPFDHHVLRSTHRNSGNILQLVNAVQQSKWPKVADNLLDLVFVNGKVVTQDVSDEYLAAVRRSGIENVALIVPIRKGNIEVEGMNVTWLNHHLRNLINPHSTAVGKTRYHLLDRVIVRKNMIIDNAVVVNGSTGTIIHAEVSNHHVRSLHIKLDDGDKIKLAGNEIANLDHAYALTVHSAQGSEYQEVICVCGQFIDGFTTRALLLTELSRARKKLIIHGTNNVLEKMAATVPAIRRTRLVQRCRAN
jgi:exodeoxyribonuclease V alpha subunit